MTATQTTTRCTIDAEVTVTNLYHVRGCTATGTVSATVPGPSVLRNEASTSRSEGIVFAVTLGDGRRVVDIGLADLRPYRANE